jgi:hypothetical protein
MRFGASEDILQEGLAEESIIVIFLPEVKKESAQKDSPSQSDKEVISTCLSFFQMSEHRTTPAFTGHFFKRM